MSDFIKVLIVEDHNLVRSAIRSLLSDSKEIKVTGEAETGIKALQLITKSAPNVILLDLNLPDIEGLKLARKINHTNPEIKILVVTASNDSIFPARLMRAGAAGYLTKSTNAEELIHAIKVVAQGEYYISPGIAQSMVLQGMRDINDSDIFTKLSDRELEIALFIAQGHKAPGIARELGLNDKTVNSHRYHIFQKLNIENDVQLALLAIRHGLVPAA